MLAGAHIRSSQSSSSHYASRLIELTTRNWIERFVIAQRLCPWAQQVATEDTMRVSVLEQFTQDGWRRSGRESVDLVCAILHEARSLAAPESKGRTTLVVLPHFASFDCYLEVSSAVEETLQAEGVDADIQVATFHPLYQFAGTHRDDAENFSNRSPYPIVHLLRIDDVESAIKTYTKLKGPTDQIWEANIASMQKAGGGVLASLLEEIKRESAVQHRAMEGKAEGEAEPR